VVGIPGEVAGVESKKNEGEVAVAVGVKRRVVRAATGLKTCKSMIERMVVAEAVCELKLRALRRQLRCALVDSPPSAALLETPTLCAIRGQEGSLLVRMIVGGKVGAVVGSEGGTLRGLEEGPQRGLTYKTYARRRIHS
jgi:hypothetical protein